MTGTGLAAPAARLRVWNHRPPAIFSDPGAVRSRSREERDGSLRFRF